MTDIVERLRKMNIYMDGKWEYPPICSEAADEIERLRAALSAVVAWAEEHRLYSDKWDEILPVFVQAKKALEP